MGTNGKFSVGKLLAQPPWLEQRTCVSTVVSLHWPTRTSGQVQNGHGVRAGLPLTCPCIWTAPGGKHEPTAAQHGSSERSNHTAALYDGRDMEQAARPDAAVLEGLSKTQKPGAMPRIG
jgi:hypothetical protein